MSNKLDLKLTKDDRMKMVKEMPFLLPRNVWTNEVVKDYDYSYIEGEYDLPDGWFLLFLQMCVDITPLLIEIDYLDKFRFTQIKEKYGTMRCYNGGATQEIHDIIMKYEYMSQYICSICGEPATKETCDWIIPICDDCWKDSYRDTNINLIDPPTFKFAVEGYCNGQEYTREFDWKEEWERYVATLNLVKGRFMV